MTYVEERLAIDCSLQIQLLEVARKLFVSIENADSRSIPCPAPDREQGSDNCPDPCPPPWPDEWVADGETDRRSFCGFRVYQINPRLEVRHGNADLV